MAAFEADGTVRAAILSPGSGSAQRSMPVRTVKVLQAALLLLVVANLGRIPIFSTGERDAPILVNDVAVALLLLVGGMAMAQARSLRLDRVALTALAFAAVGLGAAFLAIPRFGLTGFELAVSVAYLARWLFYFGVYVVVINGIRGDQVDMVWRALETAILAFAAFGIVQSAFLPNFAQLVYPEARLWTDWDVQGHRLVSSLLDPNFAGAFILMGLLVQLGQLAAGFRVPGWKPLMLFVALVLTLSRSSLLAFAVSCGVLLLVIGLSKRLLKWAALIVVLVLAMLPKLIAFAATFNKVSLTDASAMARVVVWLRGLEVFSDYPVIGIGFNTWGYVQERYGWNRGASASYGLDGGLLFIMVLTGVVGLALYLGMMWLTIRRGRRIWADTWRPAAHRGLGAGVVAVTVMIVIHSMFTNSILLPFLMEPLWVLWGLLFVLESSPVRVDRAPATEIVARGVA